MTRSRQAIHIGVVYSIPLLLWFTAELRYIDWNSISLARLCAQTLGALILLQVLSFALLFTSHGDGDPGDNLLSILLVAIYPLPILAIVWLTGSLSLAALLKGLLFTGTAGCLALLIRLGGRLLPPAGNLAQTGPAAAQITLALLVWNFRHLWQDWLAA